MSNAYRTTRRLRAWLPALSLAVACAFGCGGGCGGGGGTKDQTGKAGPAAKTFHFYRREAYKSLDPVKQFDVAGSELVGNVYDTLLQYHYLKRPYQLEPSLTTKMPELSSDGLTYTFELRDDVYFHDDPCFPGGKGRKLTSDDVVYSLQRFADANVNVLSYTLLGGTIEGLDAFREQTAKLGKGVDYAKLAFPGVTKLDERHFTIKLTQPNPIALYPLAASQLSIVPREAVKKYGQEFESHPVGTGPFVMTQSDRRGVVVLERNPRYFETYPSEGAPGDAEAGLLKAAGKRVPFVDRVELPLIEEPQPAMLKFRSGQLDWIAMDRDSFTTLAYKDAKGFHLKPEFQGKFQLYVVLNLSTEYLTFNMKDPLIGKNKALRQAIAYSLNPADFLEQMLNGRGEVLHTLIPLEVAGSERDIPSEYYKPDAKLAQQKLAEAGFPGGKGLPVLTIEQRGATSTAQHQFEFMRNELARNGIVVQANFQTFSAYLKRIESANFQIADEGWQADYPDAENFYQLVYGKNTAPGPNHGGYSNPEYDRLYEKIRSMPNGPERFALFKRMNEILREDLPILFSFNASRAGLRQNWVSNFKRNVMMEMPIKYLDIDPAAQAKGLH